MKHLQKKLLVALLLLGLHTPMGWAQTETYGVLTLADATESQDGQLIYVADVDPQLEFGDLSEVQVHALRQADIDLTSTDWQIGLAKVTRPKPDRLIAVVSPMDGILPEQHPQALLSVDIQIPKKAYRSVCFQVARFAIALKTIQADSSSPFDPIPLLDSYTLWHDGQWLEYDTLMSLAREADRIADAMRGQMEEPTIEEGRYAGTPLFDAMENAKPSDVRDFLHFIIEYPLKYRGKTWNFAEAYATWLLNGTPMGGEPTPAMPDAPVGINVQLEADPSTNYIRISGISAVAHGRPEALAKMDISYIEDVLAVGDLILAIDEQSTFHRSVEEVEAWLMGDPLSTVEVHVITPDCEVRWLDALRLPQHADPQWVHLKEPITTSVQLFPAREDDKTYGLLDSRGDMVIDAEFDGVGTAVFGGPCTFSHGLLAVEIEEQWGFINLEGTLVIPPQWPAVSSFEEGLAAVFEGTRLSRYHRMGFIDTMGDMVIPPKYYDPGFYADFHEGLAQVRTDADSYERVGFIDQTGKLVIPFQFYLPNKFSEGLCATRLDEDGKHGYIDRTGQWVIEPTYDSADDFRDGVAVVQKNNSYYVIDKQGNTIATLDAKPRSEPFHGDRLRAQQGGKVGFLDRSWDLVIPATYVDAMTFEDGLTAVTATGQKEAKGYSVIGGWHFIDPQGNTVIPGPFEETRSFSEGVCWVREEGSWGLIDRTGAWVLEPTFGDDEDVTFSEFVHGICQVRMMHHNRMLPEMHFMYIDREGGTVWDP